MMSGDFRSERSQEDDDSVSQSDTKDASVAHIDLNQSKLTVVKAKKKKKRKPKDMPKRPLSAYNIFFREERARILESWEGENNQSVNLFSVLGKKVAQRWKELDDNEKQKYNALAKVETERYNKNMEVYHLSLAQQNTKEDNNSETQESTPFSENNNPVGNINNTTGTAGYLNSSENLRSSPFESLTQDDIANLVNRNSNTNVLTQIPNLYQMQLEYNLQQRDLRSPSEFLASFRLQQLMERDRLLQLQQDLQWQQLLQRQIQNTRVEDEILRSTRLPPSLPVQVGGHNVNGGSDFLPSPIVALPEFSSSRAAQASLHSNSNQIPASVSQAMHQVYRDESRLLQLLQMQLQDNKSKSDSNDDKSKNNV